MLTFIFFRILTKSHFTQNHSISTQHEIGNEARNLFQNTLPSVINSALANPNVAEIPGLEEWIKKVLYVLKRAVVAKWEGDISSFDLKIIFVSWPCTQEFFYLK